MCDRYDRDIIENLKKRINSEDKYYLTELHSGLIGLEQGIAEELIKKFDNGEYLDEYAINIILSYLDCYDWDKDSVLKLIRLMQADIDGKLVQLSNFRSNSSILIEYLKKGIDQFIFFTNENDLNDNDISQFLDFYKEYCEKKHLSKAECEKEITNLRNIISEKIAKYALDLFEKSPVGLIEEDYMNYINRAFEYNPNNLTALKIFYEMHRDY